MTVLGIKPKLAVNSMLADQLVGADISLPCEVAEGKPAPAVLWYKDNLSVDMETVTIDQDNTLEITNANEGHSGLYVCKAENSEGSDSLTVELNVRNHSVIVSNAAHVLFEKDSQVTFDCQHEVDSALLGGLQINWFKDGVNLDLIQAPEPPPVIGENILRIEESVSPCESANLNEDPDCTS